MERRRTSFEERVREKAELRKMRKMEKRQMISKVETKPKKLMMRMF